VKVKFTPSAEAELKSILAYVRKESPLGAQKLKAKIKTTLTRLVSFPDSGRHIPEFPDFEGREVIVAPYRFFYQVFGDTIWVLAVWHSARLPTHP
jgi:toxin ParE1/3/4